MRSFADQNYYELLDIPSSSSPDRIERAYRIARETYAPSSTATYSVFSDEDNAEILRRIEEAYAVLSNPRLRSEYDRRLPGAAESKDLVPADPASRRFESYPSQTSAAPSPRAGPGLGELADALLPENGVYDGGVLRRIRMSLGVELEEISSVTKVNPHHLASIEDERYETLPAPVYVRGFVEQFARCIGLDGATVARSYLERMGARSSKAS